MAYGQPWTQPGRQIITSQMIAPSSRTHGPRVDVPGFNATITVPLYTAYAACTIKKIIINSDTATSGSDGSNNFTFMLKNHTQTQDLMASAVSTNGNEIGRAHANSSHITNSYAVFCLKKNITISYAAFCLKHNPHHTHPSISVFQ